MKAESSAEPRSDRDRRRDGADRHAADRADLAALGDAGDLPGRPSGSGAAGRHHLRQCCSRPAWALYAVRRPDRFRGPARLSFTRRRYTGLVGGQLFARLADVKLGRDIQENLPRLFCERSAQLLRNDDSEYAHPRVYEHAVARVAAPDLELKFVRGSGGLFDHIGEVGASRFRARVERTRLGSSRRVPGGELGADQKQRLGQHHGGRARSHPAPGDGA